MSISTNTVDVCEPSRHQPGASNEIHPGSVDAAARLFRALGDGPRLRLLAHLLSAERCVGDLAELEKEALSTISQRLRVLYGEKIVARRRLGKHVIYRLADLHITNLVKNALAHSDEPENKIDSKVEEKNG